MSRMYKLVDGKPRILDGISKESHGVEKWVHGLIASRLIIGVNPVYNPLDNNGNESLWPYGLEKDGNYVWLEGDMILVWGSNNERDILDILENYGLWYRYVG